MKLKFLQQGGPVEEQGAASPEQTQSAPANEQQDPMMQIVSAAQQAVQAKDPNMALQVCEALVQLVQQAQGAEQGGEQAQAAPTYQRKGGSLTRLR